MVLITHKCDILKKNIEYIKEENYLLRAVSKETADKTD